MRRTQPDKGVTRNFVARKQNDGADAASSADAPTDESSRTSSAKQWSWYARWKLLVRT